MEQIIIFHKKKAPRNRGATWSDDEVHKLFQVWSQPGIFRGFIGQRMKQDVLVKISKELMNLGVDRSWGECQTKIKNLKGDFKKAKEHRTPQTFKFYEVMDNLLRSSNSNDRPDEQEGGISDATGQDTTMMTKLVDIDVPELNQSLNLEFELMSCVDLQNMRGSQLPIRENAQENVNITDFVDTTNDGSIQDKTPQADDVTILTTEELHPKSKRKLLSVATSSQKRRKVNKIGDKMAETMEKILTKTTNALIDEIKASEERFLKWEEKRREEEQKHEEQMIKQLVAAIKSNPIDRASNESFTKGLQEQDLSSDDIRQITRSSDDDPCAVTLDLLATKLSTLITEQHRETEKSFLEWETSMQKKETKCSPKNPDNLGDGKCNEKAKIKVIKF